jgi:hypothetical protein
MTTIATNIENIPSVEIPSVELNKTFIHTITNYSFDCLSEDTQIQLFKDGRVFSHFIELWLSNNYPLKHIDKCKSHDFEDINFINILYDEKTFTSRGCKFYPSNMIGQGRKFDQQIFEEKASKLIYIIVSNINFPEIKIKFVRGSDLIIKYPKGEIKLKEFDEFFN